MIIIWCTLFLKKSLRRFYSIHIKSHKNAFDLPFAISTPSFRCINSAQLAHRKRADFRLVDRWMAITTADLIIMADGTV